MKSLQTISKIILIALLFTGANLSTQAQKLNNIQENGFWAPANVKIDGKLNDWGDTFQAYNKTTGIYYTMANDDKNLYFIMKSSDQIINNKFIAGGIDITINTTGKKKDKGAYVIKYPVINMAGLRNQVKSMRTSGPPQNDAMSGMDPAMIDLRRKALKNIKELKLTGFAADVPDSVVSVYNQYGIKTGVDYDDKGNLTCEIAIPLKYLHLNGSDFSYNIKLNGLDINSLNAGMNTASNNPNGGGDAGGDRAAAIMSANPTNMPAGAARALSDMQIMISPTDFWGKYTIVKK
ncbi:MAG: hypothetical protein JWQ79_528 [Mucilaginibacter sp.]|nr:hypothetical protein [Mucilaginibacter sp.]